MNDELKGQIESMVQDFCDEFMDVYQCADWGISAKKFAKELVTQFSSRVKDYAKDLDTEE